MVLVTNQRVRHPPGAGNSRYPDHELRGSRVRPPPTAGQHLRVHRGEGQAHRAAQRGIQTPRKGFHYGLYVCLYVCMYVCMYVCIYGLYLYVSIYVCLATL